MSAGTLRELLAADRTAWVDETGRLFYVEPDQAAALTAPPTEAAAYPYAASFTLHSRPTATRKVFLDFDGHRVQSSAWNDVMHPVIDVAAYTMDADAAFSQAELDVVQEVWARVAEDYAPFDVDVTTEDPGTAALVRSSVDDAAYGMRASVTTDPDMRTVLCSGGCAGVAYVGVFDNVMGSSGPWYQPAFALPKTTYTAAQVAEIVSHEVGHTLGLSHDGLNGSAYYQDGTGTKIWSPIMGAGYTPLTQFSNGDYSGATQTQDDLAVIAQHGPAVVGDDYGNTVGTAFPLGTGDATVGRPGHQPHRRRRLRGQPLLRRDADRVRHPGAPRPRARHPAAPARRVGRGGRRLGSGDGPRRHLVAGPDRDGRLDQPVPGSGDLLPRGRRRRTRRPVPRLQRLRVGRSLHAGRHRLHGHRDAESLADPFAEPRRPRPRWSPRRPRRRPQRPRPPRLPRRTPSRPRRSSARSSPASGGTRSPSGSRGGRRWRAAARR